MKNLRAFFQSHRFSIRWMSGLVSGPVSGQASANLPGSFRSSSVCNDMRESFGELMVPDRIKRRSFCDARRLLDGIRCLDVKSCTRMIARYAGEGRLEEALKLFSRMPVKDVICWNVMLNACVDCGELGIALELFDEMPDRTVVSWTTVINGFFKFGQVEAAERFFNLMPVRDLAVYNTMLYGYFSNCRVDDALRVFKEMPSRDVVSWTSMIGGLDQNGRSGEAVLVYREMVNSSILPTSSTLACGLTACGNASAFSLGVQTHGLVIKSGFSLNEFVISSLITFYSVSRHMDEAVKVVSDRDLNNSVVIRTALLTGFSSNNKHEEALRAFIDMFRVGVLPNQFSFSSILNSCCALEALDRGREVHAPAIKLNLEQDLYVCNSLIVMYSKCGSVNDSFALFNRTKEKNLVTWNAAISGCAQHGQVAQALALFARMIRCSVEPDEFTFTSLLTACSHSGLLQKGRQLFEYFSKQSVIELKHDHYACMVDLMGRCGKLDEAENFVTNMPLEPNSIVWFALLSAGRMHLNLKVSERAISQILKIDPQMSAAYVLMSNLYAATNQWSGVSRMRVLMKLRAVERQAGSSWVTVRGQRHIFLSGDRSHPQAEIIYQKIDWLNGKLKELGYVPDRRFALHDVEDEQKEASLSYHSERLAIAFGIISTVEFSTLIIMKNLRVCGDCHSAIKHIGQIVRRKIIVRDSTRFHHFKDGVCSCGDYW